MQLPSAPSRTRDKATVAAAKLLFDSLVRAGAAAVVFTGLALYFGTRSLEAQYAALGASWYPKLLPFDRKVWAGLFAILPLVGQMAVLLPNVARPDGMSAQQLRRAALAFLAVAIGLAFAAGYRPDWHFAAVGAALLFLLSAGSTVFEILVRIRDEAQDWSSYTVYLVYVGVFIALIQAPHQWGSALGRIELATGFSTSPEVDVAGSSGNKWRLLDATGDLVLLVRSKAGGGQQEFRLLKGDAIERIHSTNAEPAAQPAQPAVSAPLR